MEHKRLLPRWTIFRAGGQRGQRPAQLTTVAPRRYQPSRQFQRKRQPGHIALDLAVERHREQRRLAGSHHKAVYPQVQVERQRGRDDRWPAGQGFTLAYSLTEQPDFVLGKQKLICIDHLICSIKSRVR